MSFWLNVVTAGVVNGTALLFATLGELITERAGVLNLGVEGMMLLGAMAGYAVGYGTGDAWLGLLAGMGAGGGLALLHAVVTISLRADQVVSGLSLTFLGTGLSLVLGDGLSDVHGVPTLPPVAIPGLEALPILGPILFGPRPVLVYFSYILAPLLWFFLFHTRGGLNLRAIGEHPATADALGVPVAKLRYAYVCVGGLLAGLAGASLSLALSPGWFSEQTTSGQGWIAVGLVIFARWDPLRAVVGAWFFGSLRRLVLDLQGPTTLLGLTNPFFAHRNLQFGLEMLPYLLTVVVLARGARALSRQKVGGPAALGQPFSRGERGR